MRKDALISPCGTYRYWLSRTWEDSLPACVWVMLNPSTADAADDDPTIRRIIGFSQGWGFGAAKVLNLFALRSPRPELLLRHSDPIGPDNDTHLRALAMGTTVIAAWGQSGDHLGRANVVRKMFAVQGIQPECFGRNLGGSPKHPLYVRGDAPRVPFPV